MLKQEKLDNILETVNTKGTITVKEIMTRLDVSDMTARRYLQELADKDLLVRVHGGAEKIRTGSILNNERSNIEKQSLQIAEKQEISRFAGHLIDEGETIFIGPGTTCCNKQFTSLSHLKRTKTNRFDFNRWKLPLYHWSLCGNTNLAKLSQSSIF